MFYDYQSISHFWKNKLIQALKEQSENYLIPWNPDWEAELVAEVPHYAQQGELAFPMYLYGKLWKKNPIDIAEKVRDGLLKDQPGIPVQAVKGYVNIFLDRQEVGQKMVNSFIQMQKTQGKFCSPSEKQEKIVIEFSSPNTNKPLHIGHMRNNILGESLSRIFKYLGHQVKKINLVNDRGVHICQSMLAYQKQGQGKTPKSQGIKGDHFVGIYYVLFRQLLEEDPDLQDQVNQMLQKWEQQDPQVLQLWSMMRQWALEGMKQTYLKTKISFDEYNYESQTYILGKAIIEKALENQYCYRRSDGCVVAKILVNGQEYEKVLLRADKTSVYMTQDFGTAVWRYEQNHFDKMIYIVGNEQNQHFQILFSLLKKFGYSWADRLYHLSYGMILLPDGRMKSREGSTVDADQLLEQLEQSVKEQMEQQGKMVDEHQQQMIEQVALGALHYYLLKTTSAKDIIFDKKQSISFLGDTGPYLQYTGVRIQSILNKISQSPEDLLSGISWSWFCEDSPVVQATWALFLLMTHWPQQIRQAGQQYNISIICNYLFKLCQSFNSYYQNWPILKAEDAQRNISLMMLFMLKALLKEGFELLNIPYLEHM